MADGIQQAASKALVRKMGLDEANIERRKKIVGFEASDLPRITAIRDLVTQHTDDYVTAFFNHLSGLDEARPLIASRAIAERARKLKREHLVAMVQGEYGMKYVEQRIELGTLYAKAGLHARVFLAAFHQFLQHTGTAVMQPHDRKPV